MPNVLAFPDTPYAGVEENPGLRAFKFAAGTGQYYSTTIPSSLVQLDNCTVIILHKPATSGGARVLLGDATGGVNKNMYVRQQNLAYRFAANYSTTDLVYNTVNAIVLGEWNWVAVIRNLAGGGAGTRIRGWYAQGLLGRWRALTFSAPTEPVGSLVNNAGFVLNTGGNATLTLAGYDGLEALIAIIKRPLTIGEIEDFRQDPLSWREEAELFLRPGHFGPTLRDEGKSKSGRWTATGSPPGWVGTGVKDFWLPEVGALDLPGVIAALDAAVASASALAPSIILGALVTNLALATANASALSPSVILGALVTSLSAAVASASAQNVSTTTGLTATVSAAVATASAQAPSVTLGALVANLSAAVATASAQDVSASGATIAATTPATATTAGLAPSVTLGALVASLSAAVANASAQDVTVSAGTLATLLQGVATASAQGPSVVLGALSVALGTATASTLGLTPSVVLGGLSVALSAAVGVASAQGVTVSAGLLATLTLAVATAAAQAPTTTLGALVVALTPATGTATPRAPSVVVGGITVPLGPAVAVANALAVVGVLGAFGTQPTVAAAAADWEREVLARAGWAVEVSYQDDWTIIAAYRETT